MPGLTPQGFPAAPLGPRSRASDHEARAGDPHRLRAPRPKGRRVRGKKRRVSSARRERAAAAATSEPRLTARPCPAPRLTEPDVTRRDASAGKPLRMRRRGRPAEPCRSARGSARGREAERGEMGSGRSSGGGGVGRACAASRALGRDPGPRWGCRAGSAGLWHRGGGWGHREVRSEPAGGFPGSPSWRGGGEAAAERGAAGLAGGRQWAVPGSGAPLAGRRPGAACSSPCGHGTASRSSGSRRFSWHMRSETS